MRRRVPLHGTVLLIAVLATACGGRQPPPEPEPDPEPVVEPTPEPEVDREAEARRLCDRARAALEAGNYDNARELLRRAQSEYAGTECALGADSELERIDALETLQARIHFEFDRSRITDEAAETLQRKAEVLRRFPDVRITIEGHCDERGSLEYNQALGMRRAESAKRFLASLGIEEDRIRTVSYGEERPLVRESNERAWAMNRRGEFVIDEPGGLGP